ncbi:hypothetical protein LTR56_001064 [Elasticomyces elasticus]|nr:hypothetical protein LTR56_001064 [Elasticomyces elasticus]KAK3663465.1 hypothetical protein LTR22_005636 [Elasticomyces elasticus]KAK4927150.1 hypothetical protein LTR49_006066 [Elasticomyces elasticus]KAK5768986.1 hypothetical protein LTS12_000699 [Elasticomyces elasticus]
MTPSSLTGTSSAQLKFMDALKDTHANRKYTDLTIRCGDREWQVHKVVVCAQSPFFAKACDGSFKEAGEGVITLVEDDPRVVDAMFNYMYTFDYDESSNPDSTEMPQLVFDVYVLTLADKYDMPDLAQLATTKFGERAQSEWYNKAFAAAAALVFTTGTSVDAQLRRIVVTVAVLNSADLNMEGIGDHFQKVVSSVPALGSALWRKQIGASNSCNHPGYRWCYCPTAGCNTRVLMEGARLASQMYRCTGCDRDHQLRAWWKM